MLGLGLGLALAGLGSGFEPSSPIVLELVLSLTRLSFPLVRFRHNPVHVISMYYVRKGSWAFFILITHKSMGSENPMAKMQNFF